MGVKKISELAADAALSGTEIVPVVDGATTARTTVSAIAALAGVAAEAATRAAADAALDTRVDALESGTTVRTPPADFSFSTLTLPIVYRHSFGRFSLGLDISSLLPAAGTTYYVAPSGTGGADGLTAATPTTIPVALGKAGVGTIVLAPGEYFRDVHALSGVITNKNINWIASGPGVKVTGWNDPASTTWTLVSGSVYSTARSITEQVADVKNFTTWGDYTLYTKMGTTVGSVVGPGQWASDGTTVWVWAIGGTDLSIAANRYQLRLGLGTGVRSGIDASGGVHYVRGIDFEGNATGGLAFTGGAVALIEDCTAKYQVKNGYNFSNGVAILRRCGASSNRLDGFNYHLGGFVTEFIEDQCYADYNGVVAGATVGQNNASTAHETVRGLRIGGTYGVSGGPVVADVNSARTWNLGCKSGASTSGASSWRTDTTTPADPARMWLDECEAFGSDYAYVTTGTGAVIYTHDVVASGRYGLISPGSTVTAYTL